MVTEKIELHDRVSITDSVTYRARTEMADIYLKEAERQVEKAPVITLKSISLLKKKVEDVKTIVHDLPSKSYVDGLLGLSFLKQCKLAIDFKKGILDLE